MARRFAMAKAKAAKEGQENFAFDGEVYSTGIDPKKYKKLEKVQLQQAKANTPTMQDEGAGALGGENVEQPNK